jgi:hypothetical protein
LGIARAGFTCEMQNQNRDAYGRIEHGRQANRSGLAEPVHNE